MELKEKNMNRATTPTLTPSQCAALCQIRNELADSLVAVNGKISANESLGLPSFEEDELQKKSLNAQIGLLVQLLAAGPCVCDCDDALQSPALHVPAGEE